MSSPFDESDLRREQAKRRYDKVLAELEAERLERLKQPIYVAMRTRSPEQQRLITEADIEYEKQARRALESQRRAGLVYREHEPRISSATDDEKLARELR